MQTNKDKADSDQPKRTHPSLPVSNVLLVPRSELLMGNKI